MGKSIRIFGLTMAFVALVLIACMGALAIYFSPLPDSLRMMAAGLFALAALVLILSGLRKKKPWAWGAFLVLFALVFAAWWLLIPPSNDRNWQPDVCNATLEL